MYKLSKDDSSVTSGLEQPLKPEVSFINQTARELLKSQGKSEAHIRPDNLAQETEFQQKMFAIT